MLNAAGLLFFSLGSLMTVSPIIWKTTGGKSQLFNAFWDCHLGGSAESHWSSLSSCESLRSHRSSMSELLWNLKWQIRDYTVRGQFWNSFQGDSTSTHTMTHVISWWLMQPCELTLVFLFACLKKSVVAVVFCWLNEDGTGSCSFSVFSVFHSSHLVLHLEQLCRS